MKECVIYKYVYHGEIIYIGKSDNSLNNRIEGHKKEDKFQKYLDDAEIFFFCCNNPAETTIYETVLINKYSPILNKAMKYKNTTCFDIAEPEWFSYEDYEAKKIEDKNRVFCRRRRIKSIKDYTKVATKSLYKPKLETFALLAYMIDKGIIRSNKSSCYQEVIQSEEITREKLMDINNIMGLLGLKEARIIHSAEIDSNSKIIIKINTLFIDDFFFRNYKKIIGNAIKIYC